MTTSLRASAKGHLGSKPPTLRLIFPTTNTVRNSLEGWAGGGALPHNIKSEQLRGLFSALHWKDDPLFFWWFSDATDTHRPMRHWFLLPMTGELNGAGGVEPFPTLKLLQAGMLTARGHPGCISAATTCPKLHGVNCRQVYDEQGRYKCGRVFLPAKSSPPRRLEKQHPNTDSKLRARCVIPAGALGERKRAREWMVLFAGLHIISNAWQGAPLVPWPQVGSASGSLIAIPLPYDWPPTPYQRGPGGKVGTSLGDLRA